MTREEIRDLLLELTDLLIYQDSADDAKKRINDLYNDAEVKTYEDFKYALLREQNEKTGEKFSGVMFISIDWKADVEEAVWQISRKLGELSSEIAFPQEADIKRDVAYGYNILVECAMSLKEKGIVLGCLDTGMDSGIDFLTREENYAKVSLIFEKLEPVPLFPYKRD